MNIDSSSNATVIQFSRTGRGGGWNPGALEGLVQGLAGVEEVTEKSFLELGQKISGLHNNARNISGLAGQVLDILHGDGGESSLQHQQLLVERCSLWLNSTVNSSTDTRRNLNQLLTQLNGLEFPVLGLKKVTKTLHSLRVSTRIEASKGYASGAEVLAKSLDELGRLIQEKITEIFELLEDLVQVIRCSIETEEDAQAGVVRYAGMEVDKARKLLNDFLESCVETSHWTDRLKERSEGVTESFSEMVSALQFQDITRQRLEHVQKAVSNLGTHLERYNQRTDFSKDTESERLFGRICRLQHDQLSYAANEFVTAADKLSINLQTMSANVTSMAVDTRELVRVSDDGSDNRYKFVLDSLRTIAGYLEKTGETHSLTLNNLEKVAEGVKKVSTLVAEVEYIGEEVQLLAINAAISAAHARQKGAGLDVVAQNIQDVAEEACMHAMELSEMCRQITEHSTRLKTVDNDGHESSGDIGELLSEANERMSSFDSSHAKLTSLAGTIDADARHLSSDIEVILSSLRIGSLFNTKMAPVLEQLRVMSVESDEVSSQDNDAGLDELFAELELSYTMDSERKVHQESVAGQDATEVDNQGDAWAATRDHGLGDNVDLF